ncbi:pentapeptide repeat-containing protein [Sphaerospermopsis aphanizomenoides BCCUSP55]|uniref:pentapeptide repeat-containing protein n=1 Tax=Sphaerospermopsis aphanizomenoides TaxID=459663 RepID=UPI001905ABC9|nr:pentapeptide repeat-containing protein [Sphaerospermopsis aphanizomenoides]MBK1988631.1 pentapeptide repeat-containing protein [Sphaerospermopsis aphanizomenoides BCCUSP55]
MKVSLLQTWQHFQLSFSVEISPNITVDAGKAVLEAAEIIQKQDANLEVLKSVLQNSSSLLDVLCLPLEQIIGKELSFVSLGVNILRFYADITQECPTLKDCVVIVSQAAYLQSLRDILSLYPSLNWDINSVNMEEVRQKLQNINTLELDVKTATDTITCFQQSELAAAFNQLLSARLLVPNVSKYLANLLTQRIAANTHRYIIEFWSKSRNNIQNLVSEDLIKLSKQQQIIQDIDEYLKTHISRQSLEKLFNQSYSLKDIYIPLQAKCLGQNVNVVDLETWAKGVLLNQSKSAQLICVQGQPGSGKTSFCKMFADWVRQHLHPVWTPILIYLKDIEFFEYFLEETLEEELKFIIHENNDNLLNNQNTNFLFILDGLDDLQGDVETFIQQVAAFQQKCQNQPEMGHRLLITGETTTFQYIQNLPENLERVEILPLDQQLQEKWFKKWYSLPDNQGKNVDLQDFLSSKKCPQSVNQLAYNPLFLQLLAVIYQQQPGVIEKVEKSHQRTAKVVIYQEFVNWLITKQKPATEFSDVNIQENSNNQSDVKHLLREAAVCIIQSGGLFGSMSMLQSRLQDDDIDIKTTLADLYILPEQKPGDIFAAFHQDFSEFLFAEQLTKYLYDWSRFNTEDQIKQMNWQIYDLLGFGKITPNIIEYVIGMLIQIPDLYWINLFNVLDNFYINWCQGKFIDTAEETLAQNKLKNLQKYNQNYRINNLGQRQVDIYAGLNVMILLLELQRYAQEHDVLKEYIIFYPSGQPQGNSLRSDLLRLINYSNCLQGESFKSIVGQFLSATHLRATYLFQADLSYTNLNQADLSRADLSRAYLLHTNLSGAYLIAAKLIQADLTGANLSGANLIRTDLRGANLSYANLQDADLSQVDLSGANLKGANLSGVYLSGANLGDEFFGEIRWDKNTNWKDVDGLEEAKNLPAALKKLLGIN